VSTVAKIENAEAAVLEMSLFFIRHSLPFWPAQLAPVLQALRNQDAAGAVEYWGRVALMGENGLMQVIVSHEYGFRSHNPEQEQQHFQQLLQQTLDTLNNLRLYLRSGVNRPLVPIYYDSALP
jgi:hypothetical protein